MTGAFRDDWERLQLYARGPSTTEKSSMWNNMITDFPLDSFPTNARETIFRGEAYRGYGFSLRSERGARDWLARASLTTTNSIATAFRRLSNRAYAVNLSPGRRAPLKAHPRSLAYLDAHGMGQQYREFCARFDLAPESTHGTKLYYVASRLEASLSKGQPRIVEIGAGLGTLAAIVYARFKPASYTIIDLPEMLLHSSIALEALFPDVPKTVLLPGENAPAEPQGFVFVPAACANELPSDSHDLAVNIDSFQEMTKVQVREYIDLVQRIIRPGGRFANLNRRKQLESEGFDNNPLMYPYHASNVIAQWEVDPFMAATHNFTGLRLDSWMWREERIVKT